MVNALLDNLFDKSTRISVFVDDEYFLKGLSESLGDFDYDLGKFYARLHTPARGRSQLGTINRIYFYTALIAQEDDQAQYGKQEARLKEVSAIPLVDINRGRVTGRRGNRRQKGVDVQISTDMVLLAARDAFDLAGILAYSRSVSEDLKLVSDFFVEITKDFVMSEDLGPRVSVA